MKTYKHLIVLLVDILVVVLSFCFAILVVDKFEFIGEHYIRIFLELPFTMIIYIVIFELSGMYRSLWKYASVEELLRGILANFIAVNLSYIILMVFRIYNFNYSYYLIAFFIATTGTLGIRMSYRILKFYRLYIEDNSAKTRTLIVGAGHAGVMLLEEIKQNKDFEKVVIGFVDDDLTLVGRSIHSIPVLGTTAEICQIAYEHEIDTIIIAIPSLSFNEMKQMLNKVEETGCQIKMMPPFYEMIGQKQDMFKIRDIRIEDLLGREPIVLEESGLFDFIQGKTIVVTGGGGSIGSELCRQLRHFDPKRIIVVDIYENSAYDLQMEFDRMYRNDLVIHKPEIIVLIASVRDEHRMNEIFRQYKPDIVFHAAAHKHVPLMEVSPKEAIKNNVLGTYYTAKAAIDNGIRKFVLISTDKAVNPTNIMGATKRMAERIVMALDRENKTDFAAVRFGNVLGSNGSVIPLFRKQIESGGPVTVTHPDIIRYFMTIQEACQLVIQAGAYAKGGELFVLDMGEQVKILELAEKLIRLSGYEPYKDIEIQFTGLRPGEKMFEEILVDYDKAKMTENKKIFIEPNGLETREEILYQIHDIEQAIQRSDNGFAVELVKEYVTTYQENETES